MTQGFWSYRTDMIDSSVRCGKYELGKDRIELPLLIDKNPQGTRAPLHPQLDVETEKDTDGEETGPLSDAVKIFLKRIGADQMQGAVGYYKTVIRAGRKGEFHTLPITSDRFANLLITDPLSLAATVHNIHSRHPFHDPIYIPGSGGWDDVELLLFMGIEVFDTSRAYLDGSEGIFYTMTSHLSRDEVERSGGARQICGCGSCINSNDNIDDKTIQRHNVETIRRRLALSRSMLLIGRLREHVMGVLSGKPPWMAVMRKLDSLHGAEGLRRTWTWRKVENVPVTYREDLDNPDFLLWRKRILEDYASPPHKRILLLLPCSARKPYSGSRTHNAIKSALSSVRRWKVPTQRLVLTSPLGTVPMELEDLYPASYYDIPVTGEWFPEEMEMMRELTRSILDRGSFDTVICYHSDGEAIFHDEKVSGKMGNLPYFDIHAMASEEDIPPEEMLKRVMRRELIGPDEIGSQQNDVLEALNLIDFSLNISLEPGEKMNLKRTRRGKELRSGRRTLFKFGKGGAVPTLEGAIDPWMAGEGRRVEIDDFIPRGTLFTQGIEEATTDIRPGDIVLVGRGEDLRGVGRALIPGYMMRDGIRGGGVDMLIHRKDRS